MSIFKKRRPNTDGQIETYGGWVIEFNDHTGHARRITGFKDKAATVGLERQLLRLVALRISGIGPDAELSRFLDTCSAGIRDKLAEWGVIEGQRAAAGKPLTAHVADWKAALDAKNTTKYHARNFASKAKKLFDGCGWRHFSDINLKGAQAWLAKVREGGTSLATCNVYIRAAKGLCNWMRRERRATDNPLEYWSLFNERMDRRLERRAFTVEEFGRLLAATEKNGEFHGMTGEERCLLYRLAVETGLRWSELHSLDRSSFDFANEHATVTIKAMYAKNRKDDILPLRPALAAALKERLTTAAPTAKLFPGMWADKGADMLRKDLAVAGITEVDEYGRRVDFHALRHTFASLLNAAGVPLVTAQQLMRHSDPKLTANIYTHTMIGGKAEALAKLPALTVTQSSRTIPESEAQTPGITGWGRPMGSKIDIIKHGCAKTFVDANGQNEEQEKQNDPAPQGAFVSPRSTLIVGSAVKTPENWGRPIGRNGMNSDGFIRTYVDAHGRQRFGLTAKEKKYNPLQSKGFMSGANSGIRTRDLCFTKALLYH